MEKKTLNAAEQHREDVAEEREGWKTFQKLFDWEKFIFLDAVLACCNSSVAIWTKTNMTPRYGWSEIGKRLIDFVPHGHCRTVLGPRLFWRPCGTTD